MGACCVPAEENSAPSNKGGQVEKKIPMEPISVQDVDQPTVAT